jgi:hypothetical protein
LKGADNVWDFLEDDNEAEEDATMNTVDYLP